MEEATAEHLFGYGALCEKAPFAHKGAYRIEVSGNTLKLSWVRDEFARYEARDTLMSQLFNPMSTHDPGYQADWIEAKAKALEFPTSFETALYVAGRVNWFIEYYFEISPVSDAAMQAAAGVDLRTFARFRAATLALAQLHTALLAAVIRISQQDNDYAQRTAGRAARRACWQRRSRWRP